MRSIVRALLLIVLLVAIGFLAFGWWTGASIRQATTRTTDVPTGTTGRIDTTTAREKGAEIAEKAAEATAKVQETVAEAGLTAKIKAKMALDDNVKARAIDVTTNGTTVTLSGTVRSVDERERAARLARETAGVTMVVDRLRVE
jgi:hyperosmotically inducible periplasmic protein